MSESNTENQSPRIKAAGVITVLAIALLLAAGVSLYPEQRIAAGYRSFRLNQPQARQGQTLRVIKTASGTAATVIRDVGGGYQVGYFSQDGYGELSFDLMDKWRVREKLTGLMPAMLAARADKALVIGFGTGVTTSGAAAGFDQVLVAEINQATIAAGREWFGQDNALVLYADNLRVLPMDGIVALGRQTPASLDAVIMGATTPAYIAAGKLWTTNWLRLVANRLRTGGVFSTYVDASFTPTGSSNYLHALHRVFGACAYIPYEAAYVEVVCAKGGFDPRSVEAITLDAPGDTRFIAKRMGMDKAELPKLLQTLAYPVIQPPGGYWRSSRTTNTLDHPTLTLRASRRRAAKRNLSGAAGFFDTTALPRMIAALVDNASATVQPALTRYIGRMGINYTTPSIEETQQP